MQEAEQYDAIRRQVEQRFQQRSALYAHIRVYAVVNILLWIVYGFMNRIAGDHVPIFGMLVPMAFFPWPLIVMAGWGIGLVVHGMNYYTHYGEGAVRRQAAIEREIGRVMALKASYEKPKNDTHMRLTDDGELDEVPVDEDHWSEKPKRQL